LIRFRIMTILVPANCPHRVLAGTIFIDKHLFTHKTLHHASIMNHEKAVAINFNALLVGIK